MRKIVLYGISTCFQVLSPSDGQVTHVLLTRSPLFFLSMEQAPVKEKAFDFACIRHAASVRPEPGSNSHNDLFERSIGSLSSNKINFASYCLHVFCFINEAPYTLVRLLALFSFQRSTALR